MLIINSRTDICVYVQNYHPDFYEADELVDAIQAADHPTWGSDWKGWLDTVADTLREKVTKSMQQ